MIQLFGIILTQALMWYVLHFGGTAFFADYFVMFMNVVMAASIFYLARAVVGSTDEDYIMGNVRAGTEGPSGPITTYAGLTHAAIVIFLLANHQWWFGTAVWICFAAVITTTRSRAKRLLTPDTVKSAKVAMKMTDDILRKQAEEQQALHEVADDLMKQIKIITDEYDREAAVNKDKKETEE